MKHNKLSFAHCPLPIGFCLLLIFCFGMTSFAQKQGNTWYFSGGYGLDFNSSDGPLALSGSSMFPFEGSATISDRQTGRLLFYTDGISVWDSTHAQMPNGNGLWGNFSATQSAVIVPWPESDSLYYIFTVDAQAGLFIANQPGFEAGRYSGLSYSVVDMSLNGGHGDVGSIKNKGLITPTSEKITAVRHCNGKDTWVITHKWESDAFYAYRITPSGMDTIPVISNAGSIHTDGVGNNNFGTGTLGYMKASPNGKKLGLALYEPLTRIEIVDFNNSTGIVSHPITDYLSDTLLSPFSQDPYLPYGLSFSPNSQLVYVSAVNGSQQDDCDIYQYNLLAGSDSAVIKSKTTVASGRKFQGLVFQAMQIAPDNKIYVWQRWNNYMGAIESPDKIGSGPAGCNYNNKAVKIRDNVSGLDGFGLPSFIESFFGEPQSVSLGPGITVCNSDIILNAGNGSSYLWSTGATSQTITVSSSGTYTVQIYSGDNCLAQNGLIDVVKNPYTLVHFTSDTSVCGTPPVLLDAGRGTSYLWSTGATAQTITVSSGGTYTVQIYNNNTCIEQNTLINLVKSPYTYVNFTSDTSVCGTPPVLLDAGKGDSYRWSTGATSQTITVSATGTYSVEANTGKDCIINKKIRNVLAYPFPLVHILKDTSICEVSLGLNTQDPKSTYLWSNGFTEESIIITASGTYSVNVNNGHCQASGLANVEYNIFNENFSPPNVFSPNGDGNNDFFDFKISRAEVYDLNIYNRWGKLVYESKKSNDSWNGDQMDEGVYYWILNFAVCPGQAGGTKKGSVTLMR